MKALQMLQKITHARQELKKILELERLTSVEAANQHLVHEQGLVQRKDKKL